MKILINVLAVSVLALASSSLFANCPTSVEVQYRCDHMNDCGWGGPIGGRWEALTTSPGKVGEHATFTHAFWGTSTKPKSTLPNYMGDAICSYLTPEGQEITLIPTDFGVARIYLGDEWKPGNMQSKTGYICTASTSACSFLY